MNGRLGSALLVYGAVLILGVAAAAPFIDFDGRLVLEPDLSMQDFRFFHDAIRHGGWAQLPKPGPSVYFDGHSIIYGLFIHPYEAVHNLFAAPLPFDQAAIRTIGLVNGTAHVLATLVFFATVRRLSDQLPVALLLTAFFALSPQILDIHMLRIDRLMMLPLVALLHASVVIARHEARWTTGVVLGVALGTLSATKISGFLFIAFPAIALTFAVLARGGERAALVRMGVVVVSAALVGAPVFAALMIRHLVHGGHIVAAIKRGYANQMEWLAVLPVTPRFYYNIDLFAGYGQAFLPLVALALVAVAAAGVRRRDAAALWLIACLALFSVTGFVSLKYGRGGYHLVPLYLYALAMAAPLLRQALARRLPIAPPAAVAVAALAVPAMAVVDNYVGQAGRALQWPAAVERTRFEPRAWMAGAFAPGTRVCMLGSSQWTSPPLKGLGLHVTTLLFEFPYLYPAEMAAFLPPTLAQVSAACDVFVLNSFHKPFYPDTLRFQGAPAVAQAWEALFQELETRYPPKIFAADVEAYYVSRIEVYDLRNHPATPDPFSWADRRRHPALGDGVLEHETLRFGTVSAPLVPSRFAGYVDDAWRIGDMLVVRGWAVDTVRQEPAPGILTVAGLQVAGFDGGGAQRRADVATHFQRPDYRTAGFLTCVDMSGRPPGMPVRLFAVAVDGAAGEIGPVTGVPVRRPPPDEPEPAFCRSAE